MRRVLPRVLVRRLAVPLLLVGLVAFLAMPPAAQEAKVQKLVFASAGFEDSNRFWMVSRPDHLQYDPFLETLLDVDPKTGEYTPRLAEKWQSSPDYREWTFFLRKGVQFHFGYGEFTARDVVHSHAFMLRPEATATLSPFWRGVEEVKVVNDHQVVFSMKKPSTTMPYAASRAGDLRIVSKTQWDKEGLEGFEKRPAGTGSYRYAGRQPGSVDHVRARRQPLAREAGLQAAGVQAGARRINAAGPRDLGRGAHRRPATRAAEGRPQEGFEDLLVLVSRGLDDRVLWRPVLHARRPTFKPVVSRDP